MGSITTECTTLDFVELVERVVCNKQNGVSQIGDAERSGAHLG